MKTITRISIVAALALGVFAAVALKKRKLSADPGADQITTATVASSVTTSNASAVRVQLPRVLDLGASKCIPCKMMAPILEELKKEYAGRMSVEFIDVWVNPDAAKPYGIEVIPTQIFFDADGKELFRHIGFFGKEEILGKWKELGVDISAASPPPPAVTNNTNLVVAYYFHGRVRCETCLKIERLARLTLEKRFVSELAAGRLVFTSVNYDEPTNRVFQERYRLTCPSLVLVRHETGKAEQWKLLGETWPLVEDAGKFSDYVGIEAEKFLPRPQ